MDREQLKIDCVDGDGLSWHKFFAYDPKTGNLVWKERPRNHFASESRCKAFNTAFANVTAGCNHGCGYITVGIMGKQYLAHRIIWEMHYGPIPHGVQIDHVNGVRSDNRIGNLRLADANQNAYNKVGSKPNGCGLKGVRKNTSGPLWSAQITHAGRKIHLGSFANKLLAYDAYIQAAINYHGSYARFS